MLSKSGLRRRWLGSIALVLALGLLILGETALKGRLSAGSFLLYWLICFLLTVSAIVAAFLDVRDVQRFTVHQHRDLLDKTLSEIEIEARQRQDREKESGSS